MCSPSQCFKIVGQSYPKHQNVLRLPVGQGKRQSAIFTRCWYIIALGEEGDWLQEEFWVASRAD